MTPPRRPGEVCHCHGCTVAGCTRPPVNIAGRELHGRELQRYYADVDRRAAVFARLRADLAHRRAQ